VDALPQPNPTRGKMNPKLYLIAGCIALSGLSACTSSAEVLDRSQFLAEQHNFHKAYWIVANALDENPGDPDLGRAFWERRLDYLLDRGQQLVFHEQENEAIAEFQKALALDPENRSAKLWIQRSREKLAESALRLAETLVSEGNLPGALKLYNKALSHVPEIPEAVEGIKKVNERYQKRTEKSSERYLLASRARGEQKFRQSHYQSGLAEELDASNEKAKELRVVAGRRLANELLDRARASEEKGFYAAALHDYEQVKADLPEAEGIDERIAAMGREVKARGLCEEAEMLTRKGEFDEAEKKLDEAFQMSKSERATVSGQMLDNKRHRSDELYQNAKDLELEHDYEAALEAFKAIDKAWPSQGFLDVKARISGLESYIEEAEKSYKAGRAAEKAGKLKEAIEHYEEAVLVYPGFKNLERRIAELKTRAGS
jgi:tetratricopeptide (TPR) repeat protein